MAALTTAAIVGAAVVGAAATVHSVNQQKRAANRQKKAIKEQETTALEAAKRTETRDSTDARVKLGREDDVAVDGVAGSARAGATSRKGSVASRVGGLSTRMKGRASTGIGL